jgi:hypothetical protein
MMRISSGASSSVFGKYDGRRSADAVAAAASADEAVFTMSPEMYVAMARVPRITAAVRKFLLENLVFTNISLTISLSKLVS